MRPGCVVIGVESPRAGPTSWPRTSWTCWRSARPFSACCASPRASSAPATSAGTASAGCSRSSAR